MNNKWLNGFSRAGTKSRVNGYIYNNKIKKKNSQRYILYNITVDRNILYDVKTSRTGVICRGQSRGKLCARCALHTLGEFAHKHKTKKKNLKHFQNRWILFFFLFAYDVRKFSSRIIFIFFLNYGMSIAPWGYRSNKARVEVRKFNIHVVFHRSIDILFSSKLYIRVHIICMLIFYRHTHAIHVIARLDSITSNRSGKFLNSVKIGIVRRILILNVKEKKKPRYTFFTRSSKRMF